MAGESFTLQLPDAPRRGVRISLTPLIDVVFILLVFFMLASSYIDWRVISLGTGGSGASSSSLSAVQLVLQGDGRLRYGDSVLDTADVAARLRSDHADALPPVVLQPAPGVDLQSAVAVLDRLASDGVTQLSLSRGAGP